MTYGSFLKKEEGHVIPKHDFWEFLERKKDEGGYFVLGHKI